jgi:hypothetical protein
MEATVIWGMTPCSLIEVLVSVRRNIQTTVIFRSFLAIEYLRLLVQFVDTFQFGLLSDTSPEDVRTVA